MNCGLGSQQSQSAKKPRVLDGSWYVLGLEISKEATTLILILAFLLIAIVPGTGSLQV